MTKQVLRSPLFYVGSKYRLMRQFFSLFPSEINNFYEPFVGGGTVFLNVTASKYFLNDVDKHLITVHKFLRSSAQNPKLFFAAVEKIICKYGLSCSYKHDIVPASLKAQYHKTYYAKFNKAGYEKLRTRANKEKEIDPLILYILSIYGFNRMLRFNSAGKFNLPVGNVDFNKNVIDALNDYFDFVHGKKIQFTSNDFRKFFEKSDWKPSDFVYLDPPYLITASEYNKLWSHKDEADLLDLIDQLDKKNVRFALSNVVHYNGMNNLLLSKWIKKHKVHSIRSNYISYHNNTQKEIQEILVTNY